METEIPVLGSRCIDLHRCDPDGLHGNQQRIWSARPSRKAHMKKLILIGIILAGMTGHTQADANKVIADITSAPVKLQNHIQSEVANAKEYQKNSWAEAKAQWLRLKAKFIKN